MPAPRNAAPRPGDMTAVRKQALEKEHAEELAARAAELSTTEAADKHAHDNVVIDYFENAGVPLPEEDKSNEPEEPSRVVRMKSTIEQMAYGLEIREEKFTDDQGVERTVQIPGAIRFFDFEEGQQYRLPTDMANYLDAKGYVFH